MKTKLLVILISLYDIMTFFFGGGEGGGIVAVVMVKLWKNYGKTILLI